MTSSAAGSAPAPARAPQRQLSFGRIIDAIQVPALAFVTALAVGGLIIAVNNPAET